MGDQGDQLVPGETSGLADQRDRFIPDIRFPARHRIRWEVSQAEYLVVRAR